MTADPETARARRLDRLFAAGFALATVALLALARQTGLGVFAALATLALWALVATLGNALPPLRFYLRTVLRGVGVATVGGLPVLFYLTRPVVHPGATESLLQFSAVVCALFAFGFHFLATYGANVLRETPAVSASTALSLARLLALAHATLLGALLALLYAQRPSQRGVEIAIHAVTALLVAETLLYAVVRLFQPARLRTAERGFGHSVLLPALFGQHGPLRTLAASLERNLGIHLADTWLVRLASASIAPLLLLGLLALWASTAVTQVPLGSRGVLVQDGAFATEALAPGLHAHPPWPFARVQLVATERVQELSLGFERDLSGPVLWVEKHFEGEQNFLVGQGEELLTINVPVHYRVRDAVAFLRHTGDARAALTALGYRELLALTTTHTAFGLITTDRAEVAAKLRTQLQAAVDRLQLGLEIVFVGLKDVHPPVAVAAAYQDVISAEEHRAAFGDVMSAQVEARTTLEQARTYRAQTAPQAASETFRTRQQASADATELVTRARGEAASFLALLAQHRTAPALIETRLRAEAVDLVFSRVRTRTFIPADTGQLNLLLRDAKLP